MGKPMSLLSLPQAADSAVLAPQIVINTRPIERAAPLTCHLEAAGFMVVDMPMLSLQPRPLAAVDIEWMRHWLAGDYQALVIVSPTAAAAGLAVLQALEHEEVGESDGFQSNTVQSDHAVKAQKAPSHIIAVGAATAAVLYDASLPTISYDVRQPAIANNEGMLAMPEIEQLQAGDKLLVWRGLGGRRLLVDTLQARGIHIDSIAWYERILPADAHINYQQGLKTFNTADTATLAPPKPIVIISSGTAFEHWTDVVHQAQSLALGSDLALDRESALTLSDFSYVVLGERLANIVATQQLSYWRVEDLAPETILAAIQSGSR
jgi:uroporphyrinogen-III synthase